MAHSNPIRVLILHSDPVAREGLMSAFTRYADLQVIGADDGLDNMSTLGQSPVTRSADVFVADYDHGTELATLASLRAVASDACKILIVASSNREWEIRSALGCGVRGYILVGCALDELAAGVRAVNRGLRYLSPQVALRLAEILAGDSMTAREEEVLRLVVEGMCNKAIARRLGIAVGTVKSHLKGIFGKLNVESRTQAICAAERRGLLREAPQCDHSAVVPDVTVGIRARPSEPPRQYSKSLASAGL
jgi:DNA-binding NarL/FixJ family response regulator